MGYNPYDTSYSVLCRNYLWHVLRKHKDPGPGSHMNEKWKGASCKNIWEKTAFLFYFWPQKECFSCISPLSLKMAVGLRLLCIFIILKKCFSSLGFKRIFIKKCLMNFIQHPWGIFFIIIYHIILILNYSNVVLELWLGHDELCPLQYHWIRFANIWFEIFFTCVHKWR